MEKKQELDRKFILGVLDILHRQKKVNDPTYREIKKHIKGVEKNDRKSDKQYQL